MHDGDKGATSENEREGHERERRTGEYHHIQILRPEGTPVAAIVVSLDIPMYEVRPSGGGERVKG